MKLLKKSLIALLLISLLCPIVALLASAADGEEQTPVSAELTEVKDGRDAIVTLVFDDGDWDTALFLDEQLAKYDLAASLMLITRRLETTNAFQGWHIYSEWWERIFSNGNLSPENHSYSHMVLPTQKWSDSQKNDNADLANNTPENYQTQLVYSKQQLQEWFGVDAITFAASNNTLSRGAMEVAMQTFHAVRMGERGINTTNPDNNSLPGGWYNLRTERMDGTTLADHIGWINEAVSSKGWFLGFAHTVEGEEKQQRYIDTFEYMNELQKDGTIWVATFDEATKYIRARQNSTVSAYQSGESVFVSVTMNGTTESADLYDLVKNETTGEYEYVDTEVDIDGLPLDKGVFDVPLTVKVAVPSAWKAVSYELDGAKRYAKTFTDGTGTYAYVDAPLGGDTVKVEAAEYTSGIANPTVYGSLTANGFVAGELSVSGETVTLANGGKVYAKVNVSDLTPGVAASLPIIVTSEAIGTLDIYGITDPTLATGWSASKLNYMNAPATDRLTGDMTADAELIGSLEITGSGTYLFDVSSYLSTMKSQGAEVGTVVIALNGASVSNEVSIAFGTADDVPTGTGTTATFTPYSYSHAFENFDDGTAAGITRGGIGSNGSSFKVVSTENHTPGGTKSIAWHNTQSYERIWIPYLFSADNTLSEDDVNSKYEISLWVKASAAVKLRVAIHYLNSSKTSPSSFIETYTPSAENFDEWVKLTYEITVTEDMLAANNNVGLDRAYLAIKCESSSNSTIYIDDIVSTKINESAQTAVIPAESAATRDDTLTVSKNTAVNTAENASYAYLSASIPENHLLSQYLNLTVTGGESSFMIYGVINGTLSEDTTMANAPGFTGGKVDPAKVYRTIPLYEGEGVGDITVNVKAYAEAVGGECLFLIVTNEVGAWQVADINFEFSAFTAGVDYTSDGTVDFTSGAAVVNGTSLALKNCFFENIGTDKTITVSADVSSGVTMTLGEVSVTSTERGRLTLTTTEGANTESEIVFSGTAGFTVDNVSVNSRGCPITFSANGIAWEAVNEDEVLEGFAATWKQAVDQAAESGEAVLSISDEVTINEGTTLAPITKGTLKIVFTEGGKIVNRNANTAALFTVSGGSLVIEGANPVCDIETGGTALAKRITGDITLDGVKVNLGTAKLFADDTTTATFLGISYFATSAEVMGANYAKAGDPGVAYNPTGDYIFSPANISVNISETEAFVYNYAVVDTKNANEDACLAYYTVSSSALTLTTVYEGNSIPNGALQNLGGIYVFLNDTSCGFLTFPNADTAPNDNNRNYTFLLDVNGHTLTSSVTGAAATSTVAGITSGYNKRALLGCRGATFILTSTRASGRIVTGATGAIVCDARRGNQNYFGGYNYAKEKTNNGNNLTVTAGTLFYPSNKPYTSFPEIGIHFNGGSYIMTDSRYAPIRIPTATYSDGQLTLDCDGAYFRLSNTALINLASGVAHPSVSFTNTTFENCTGIVSGDGLTPTVIGAGCSFVNSDTLFTVKDGMTVLDPTAYTTTDAETGEVTVTLSLADGVKLVILKKYENGVLSSTKTQTVTSEEYASFVDTETDMSSSGFEIVKLGKWGYNGNTSNTYSTDTVVSLGTFKNELSANILLDTSITVNMYLPTALPECLSAIYLDGERYTLSETVKIMGVPYYVISISRAPKDAYRDFTLGFELDLEGKRYELSLTYGVADYFDTLMSYDATSSYIQDSQRLAKYIANYIVEISKHFETYDGTNESFIAMEALAEGLLLALPEGEKITNTDTFGVTAAYLELKSTVGFVFTLDDALANTVITMKFAGEDTVYTGTHGVTEGGIHYVVFDGIHAYDFAKRITVTVGELGSFDYDLYTYVASMVESGKDNGTGFAVATYAYAKEAESYRACGYTVHKLH